MTRHLLILIGVALAAIAAPVAHTQATTVKAVFALNGKDAGLKHVRVRSIVLDDGTPKVPGYAVLISARPATGDIQPWRSGVASERGSFIYLMLEANGNVWVAELGHAARSGGRFGVVTELNKEAFQVAGGRITGHFRTTREETFSDDRYTIDLTFDAPIEKN